MSFGAFRAALDDLFEHKPPARLGLAVSGGGDSIALLHMAARWAKHTGTVLHVVTVDHGLRPAAVEEAVMVAAQAAELGLTHDTVHWRDWDGTGNLQFAARTARRELIADWADAKDIHHIATGHTLDDQAETVLLRLARGSGIDGLAGMSAITPGAPQWLRPLLNQRRAALRDWLQDAGIAWADDPSNDDPTFDRVRARALQGHLADLGLTPERSANLAAHMGHARTVLRDVAHQTAQQIVTQYAGDLLFDCEGFDATPDEIKHRLLAAGVMWVASGPYRPRFSALTRFAQRSTGQTLAGVRMHDNGTHFRLTREYNAVKDRRALTDQPWDTRWHLTGPHDRALHIAALGLQGLPKCPDWRATGLPRTSLLSSPAIWQGDALIAAPLAGLNPEWQAKLAEPRDDFAAFVLSH